MIHIVTDSTADMPVEWRSQYDINVVPIALNIGNESYQDGIDLDSDQFFRLINDLGEVPKTAAPTPFQFKELYRRIARSGERILSIHASDKLSRTLDACKTAARELKSEFKITPFNSLGGSAAIGFMCREASELSRAGASLDAIVKRLEFIRENVSVILTLDTLDFARMSGRVGALAAALASVLKLKPIIELQEGMLVMTDKVRTRSRSIDRVFDKARQRFQGRLINAAVMHVRARDVAEELYRRVQTTFECKELFLEQINNAITAQLGPGAVGIVAYPVEQP